MSTASRLLIAAALAALVFAPASVRAGNVTVSVGGGTLKVVGDVTADDVTISGVSANAVNVTPGAGTTVNGSGAVQMFSGITKGFKIALDDGDDDLTIQNLDVAAVAIKTGAGADEVRITNASILTKATIDLGADNNALEICTVGLPNITIKSGAPNGFAASAECVGFVDAESDSGSVVVIGDVHIAGKLAMKMGTGEDIVGVVNVSTEDDAKIALGPDSGAVGLCDVSIEGKLTIVAGKSVSGVFTSFTCDTANASGEVSIVLQDMSVTGALKVKAADGNDDFTIQQAGLFGKSTLDAGAGNNDVRLFGSTFHQDMSAKTSKGADLYDIQGVTVHGDAKFTLGAGGNTFESVNGMSPSHIDGDLTVKAGKNNDSINTSGITVGGTRKIDGGGGSDTIVD